MHSSKTKTHTTIEQHKQQKHSLLGQDFLIPCGLSIILLKACFPCPSKSVVSPQEMHEPPPCTEPAVFSSRRRKMMRATSHSEITSIAPSSASPAAAAAYYVQSPSRDSHDEIDKYSSSSPLESPSDPRHSMGSSSSTAGSRISGNRRRWNKHYCNVVAEDGGGAYGDDENEYENPWPSKCLMFVVAFGLCFAGICLVIWGASTHYKPQVTIKV